MRFLTFLLLVIVLYATPLSCSVRGDSVQEEVCLALGETCGEQTSLEPGKEEISIPDTTAFRPDNHIIPEGIGSSCDVGQGECVRTGTYVAQNGKVVCDAVPGSKTTETCNGKDDDCDGQVDNGSQLCQKAETCAGKHGCAMLGTQYNPASSCKQIVEKQASRGDGVYWLKLNARTLRVYCDMTTKANGVKGGWTLCLNASFDGTIRSRLLFSSTYAHVYDPINDPYGYFDYCNGPTQKGEFDYRLVLAKHQKAQTSGKDGTYAIVLDALLTEATPYKLLFKPGGDRSFWVGVQGKGLWLKAPEDSVNNGMKPTAYDQIRFWNYDYRLSGNLHYARGFGWSDVFGSVSTNDPKYVHAILSGCGHELCPKPITSAVPGDIGTQCGTSSYIARSSYIRTQHGPTKACHKIIKGDRVQVYFR